MKLPSRIKVCSCQPCYPISKPLATFLSVPHPSYIFLRPPRDGNTSNIPRLCTREPGWKHLSNYNILHPLSACILYFFVHTNIQMTLKSVQQKPAKKF